MVSVSLYKSFTTHIVIRNLLTFLNIRRYIPNMFLQFLSKCEQKCFFSRSIPISMLLHYHYLCISSKVLKRNKNFSWKYRSLKISEIWSKLFCQAHWWKVQYIKIQKLSSNINLIFPKLSGIVYKGLHHHSNNNSNQQDSSKIWIIQMAIEVTEIPTGIGVWWFEIVTIQVRECRGEPIKIGHKLKKIK